MQAKRISWSGKQNMNEKVMTYIYENKHPLNALLDAAVYLVAMTLSIIVIAIAISPSFFHTTILAEDGLWYLLVTPAIITLPIDDLLAELKSHLQF